MAVIQPSPSLDMMGAMWPRRGLDLDVLPVRREGPRAVCQQRAREEQSRARGEERWAERDVREVTDDVAGRVVLARVELGDLRDGGQTA